MDINIKGNPGTGNVFQEIHINNVETYAPNATTVINNHYADKRPLRNSADVRQNEVAARQRQADIMDYVGRLKKYVSQDWRNRYETTWERILNLPEVASVVYDQGRQRDTTFNRNLVANIIYVMCRRGIIAELCATSLTMALEDDKEHSVRAQLGREPENRELTEKIKELLDNL